MKVLGAPRPTPEQLRIIGDTRAGTEVIRGAAGSGKTTTALLRLRNLSDMFAHRRTRTGASPPVRALALTFNRTLCGYVEALAQEQAAAGGGVNISVHTYAQWAMSVVGPRNVNEDRSGFIARAKRRHDLALADDFINAEIEYVLGRFTPEGYDAYLDIERTGRGALPRVDRPNREKLVRIVREYRQALIEDNKIDWEDLPTMLLGINSLNYDIIIVDEAQDFSANQIRSVVYHLSDVHALTLVLDTAQRLYPRGYTWAEVGIQSRATRFYRLRRNHRNTVEIAAFAQGLLDGVVVDDDGTLPDLTRAVRHGPAPLLLRGRYASQLDAAVAHLRSVDLTNETVAFLHPLGWFGEVRKRLRREHLPFEDITRARDWPAGSVNIALCTMHSAKGLEFDHVVIIGLNDEVTPHGDGGDDDRLVTLRRLLAMAIARARVAVIVGYKVEDASILVAFFKDGTFEARNV